MAKISNEYPAAWSDIINEAEIPFCPMSKEDYWPILRTPSADDIRRHVLELPQVDMPNLILEIPPNEPGEGGDS